MEFLIHVTNRYESVKVSGGHFVNFERSDQNAGQKKHFVHLVRVSKNHTQFDPVSYELSKQCNLPFCLSNACDLDSRSVSLKQV